MLKQTFAVLTTGLALFITWLSTVAPIIVLLICFIVFDTVMGIAASIYAKKPILSRKLQRFIVKSLLYSVTLLAFYGVDDLLINDALIQATGVNLALTKIWATFLCSVEAFSIDEKFRSMNRGRGFAYYFNRSIRRIRNAKQKISSITENNEGSTL